MRARGSRAASVVLLSFGCSSPDATPPNENEEVCVGTSRAALSAVDRKIVGEAAPYPADGTLRARDAELAASQRKRREVAWATVAKVLAPAPIREPLPSAAGLPHEIPAWQTWYGLDDLRRVFHSLYEPLTVAEKEARARLDAAALDEAFLWNTRAVEELPTWPAERYFEYLAAIDQAGEIAGLGGISRVGYSPAAGRHLLRSYPEILACRDAGAPPARAVGPAVEAPVAREAVEGAACEPRLVGLYAIDADETLRGVLEEGDEATLTLRAGAEVCATGAGIACEISGPALVEVTVDPGPAPLRSVVELTRRSTKPAWSACLDGAFPVDSAIVKADYRRADLEIKLPVFSTSAAALRARLDGDASWEIADGEADPGPTEIHTLTLPNGNNFRLAALHLMTKELDHWQWITLWWSDSPDDDFGADRPPEIAALGGPWSHYKMCVVTAFDEKDPLAGGGYEGAHPTLAEALAATYGGVGAPTWCSNPYLEQGHGNAGTNCIGCHQYGGTDLASEEVLTFTERGRLQVRNNFPSDYSWATTAGDELALLFADEELYFLGPR